MQAGKRFQPNSDLENTQSAESGIGISTAQQVSVGQRALLNFDIPFNGKKHNIAVVTKVTYCIYGGNDGFKAGLQFVDIDIDAAAAIVIANFMKQM